MARIDDLAEIDRRLCRLFGTPRPERRRGSPGPASTLATLVQTVLSQRTSWSNSRLAFRRLRRRYPSWGMLRAAPIDDVAGAVRPAGLAERRAANLVALFGALGEDPEQALAGLEALPVQQALDLLERLPGVGPVTAACTLLFGLGRPALPVEAGIHRLLLRLGVAPPGMTERRLQRVLQPVVAPERVYPLHVNLIRFARSHCTATHPTCHVCPLNDLCDAFLGRRLPAAVAPAAGFRAARAGGRRRRGSSPAR